MHQITVESLDHNTHTFTVGQVAYDFAKAQSQHLGCISVVRLNGQAVYRFVAGRFETAGRDF